MTLTTTLVKVQYDGDDATVSFPITFPFWADSEIKAILTDVSGSDIEWAIGTQYTLSGGDGSTGTLTVETSPADYTPATGELLTIKSDLPQTQPTPLPLGGSFPSTSVQDIVDKNVRLSQQLSEEVNRSIRLNATSEAAEVFISDPVTGEFLRWKADGSIESTTIIPTGTATSVDETDTNTTKDKLISNALAKRAEDTAQAVVGVQAASAVNQLQITNSAAGNPILVDPIGTDANPNVQFTNKGTGKFKFDNIGLDGNTMSSEDTNGDLILTPDAIGDLILDGVAWPQADGAAAQFLATNGAGQAVWVDTVGITSASSNLDISTGSPTAVTVLSGLTASSIIEIYFENVSTNTAATAPLIQLGTGVTPTYTTTGYSGAGINVTTSMTKTDNTAGFLLNVPASHGDADAWTGTIQLHHYGANVWGFNANGYIVDGMCPGHGAVSLGGELTAIRLTTLGGTATFDSGLYLARVR